jgi:hypothetical protein
MVGFPVHTHGIACCSVMNLFTEATVSVYFSVSFLADTSPIADGFKKKLKIGDAFSIM